MTVAGIAVGVEAGLVFLGTFVFGFCGVCAMLVSCCCFKLAQFVTETDEDRENGALTALVEMEEGGEGGGDDVSRRSSVGRWEGVWVGGRVGG